MIRLGRILLAMATSLSLGVTSGPVLAASTVDAVDGSMAWGTPGTHFPQNKQAETTVATNPTNPLNSISGAIDMAREPDCIPDPTSGGSLCYPGQTTNSIGVSSTQDGGKTWGTQILDFSGIGKLANADPGVAFGPRPDGRGGFSYTNGARAYVSAMAFPLGNVTPFSEPVVAVTRSDDSGSTWLTPVVATDRVNPRAQFNDKPSIWADNNPSSPHFGTVYVVWALLTGVGRSSSTFFCTTCPVAILLTRSTDGGDTWSVPVTLSSSSDNAQVGYREGPAVRTDREGRVLVAWKDNIGATRRQSTMVAAVSTDGGQHFQSGVIGATYDANPLPGASFPNDNFISLDVDQTSDAIYAAWTNYNAIDSAHGHGIMMVMKSTDHGQTWSSAGSITVPGRSAFHPALAVTRQGSTPAASSAPGRVVVGFSALTDVPWGTLPVAGRVNYLPYITVSDDGGASWAVPVVPMGAGSSDPAATAGFLNDFGSEFVGDYAGMSAAPDGKTFLYSYTSVQNGSPCSAVDAFRTGAGPVPNIYAQCLPTFGNTDIHVTTITTP